MAGQDLDTSLVAVPSLGELVELVAQLTDGNRVSQYVAISDAPPASFEVDASDLLAPFGSTSFDARAVPNVVHWTAPDGEADAVRITLRASDYGPTWTIEAEPGATSVNVPLLPDNLAPMRPIVASVDFAAIDDSDVDGFTGWSYGGSAAERHADVVERLDTETIFLTP